MQKENKSKGKQKIKYIIGLSCLLTIIINSIAFATLNVVDVTPPKGRIEIDSIIEQNNTSYVRDKEVTVKLYATDDMCSEEEIKYYLSTTQISNAEEIEESLWKSYSNGITDTIELPESLNTIYGAFKDATGNTSVIYDGTDTKYTVTYDENSNNLEYIPEYESDLLANVVEIGDYVDYPVEYNNVACSGKLIGTYTGWRVISKNIDLDGNSSPGTVNLISAGGPLSYEHDEDGNQSIEALVTNFLTTPITSVGYGGIYPESGFITEGSLIDIFTNEYTAMTDESLPKVRSVIAEDILRVTGDTELTSRMDLSSEEYKDLFLTGGGRYWVATQWYENIYYVHTDGEVSSFLEFTMPVRPVVSLKSTVTTSGQDANEVWNISVGNESTEVSVKMPTGTNLTAYHGMPFVVTTQIPQVSGYDFVGWSTNLEATVASYKPGSIIPANIFTGTEKNTNLYAIWAKHTDNYIIRYDANGGSLGNIPQSQEKGYGKILILDTNIPIREGYTFKGWATSSNSTLVNYKPGSLYNINANLELFAVWEKNVYTISYNLNGGKVISEVSGYFLSAPSNQTLEHGESITISDDLVARRRCTFKGWATTLEKAKSGIVDYESGSTYSENRSVTLYAVLVSNLIPSIANTPLLGKGMNAVYWSDDNATTELTSTTFTTDMYNYKMGNGTYDSKNAKWANAQTEDGSYWVWIPRYAYKITYYQYNQYREIEEMLLAQEEKSLYGDIDVLFMYGTSSTHYRDENGNPQPLPNGYIVHPAFQAMTTSEDLTRNPLGKWDSELEGIWVAKYQASREDSTNATTWIGSTHWYGGGNYLTTNAGNTNRTKIRLVAKPSKRAWCEIDESTIYTNCERMYPELNSHQMKNSEWGAVAYLTHSPYGRNGHEVAINASLMPYTGAGKGKGYSDVYEQFGHYSYDESTFSTTYAWNTALGKLASTTGNIYGVYDMSGAAYERVASYVESENEAFIKYSSALKDSTIMRNKQIYYVGDTKEETYEANSSIYGDAIYETSINRHYDAAWFGDDGFSPSNKYPLYVRGEFSTDMDEAGIYAFRGDEGDTQSKATSFRPVLCVTSNK